MGGICVSRPVRDYVHGRLDLAFEPVGELTLKNIARPVEAFVVRLDAMPRVMLAAKAPRRRRRTRRSGVFDRDWSEPAHFYWSASYS